MKKSVLMFSLLSGTALMFPRLTIASGFPTHTHPNRSPPFSLNNPTKPIRLPLSASSVSATATPTSALAKATAFMTLIRPNSAKTKVLFLHVRTATALTGLVLTMPPSADVWSTTARPIRQQPVPETRSDRMPVAKAAKNAATTPARPAIRQWQLPNATTQSATNAAIPVTKPKTATPARDTTTAAEHGSIVPEPSVIRTLHVAAPTARATIFRTSATTKATAKVFTATAIVPATALRPASKAVTAMQRRRAVKAGRQRPAQPATVKYCTTTRPNPVQAVTRHRLIPAIRRPAIV